MMSENNLRKSVFWLQDRLKGGIIKSFYNEMMDCYKNGTNEGARQEQLNRLLRHAVSTTDFYSQFSDYKDLSDFPVISKPDCRNEALFMSGIFKGKKKIRKVITSGSTGIPLTVYHDPVKVARGRASVAFYGHLSGYEIGMRQANFRIWAGFFKRSRLSALKQNIYMVNVSDVSEACLCEVCRQLVKQKVESILGYASALEDLCRYIIKCKPGLKFPAVKSVVSCAETLQEHTRLKLLSIFECPVLSRYSNLENGLIAQQTINDGSDFYIDTSSYYIEMLKLDSDKQAEEGEVGRIVLTDLYNYAYPLIRYDTGDTGILRHENGRSFFKDVYGRIVDAIFGENGHVISPYALDMKLENEKVIRQYQFQQTGELDYVLKLNLEPGTEFDPKNAVIWMKSFLGENANIKVEFVDEIPIMASGKRKIFVNLWKAPGQAERPDCVGI
jgi:phenylacetate-CoA ligase